MPVIFVEHVKGLMQQRGLTRAQLADKMGEPWTKERLDKTLAGDFCPRAETCAEILEALGEPTLPPKWFASKVGEEEPEYGL